MDLPFVLYYDSCDQPVFGSWRTPPLLNVGSEKNKEEKVMITKEQKSQIIAEYGRGEGDTGSPEVQVAILTARINDLTDHFRS